MTTRRSTTSVEPVTASEVKTLIPLDGTDHDTRIGVLITALRQQAEQITGRAFASGNFILTLDEFPEDEDGDGEILLYWGPVSAMVTFTYVDTAGATQTLTAAGYQLDMASVPARLLPPYGETWPATKEIPNAITITYTTGYGASAPKEVQAWIASHIKAEIDGCEVPAYIDGLLDSLKVY